MSVAIAAIVGWALITIYRMQVASKAREQVHRERMAMIEKGLVPPPEPDPRMLAWESTRGETRGQHTRRVGLILLATGIGVGLMLYFMNESVGRAIGVGIFLSLLGIAFLVNAFLDTRSTERDQDVQTRAQRPT